MHVINLQNAKNNHNARLIQTPMGLIIPTNCK